MSIVVLYCVFNIRIKFAGYQTETKYMTEIKTSGCVHTGGHFISLFSCGGAGIAQSV